ncbi:hypothetical protein Taro_018779 [Colocasia esculenta]|uniref:Uncharacterized protein n=1 Tax=Colocasia esculenta TaxID=4460 RepID=A0A843URY0_COLES|nr:hypothetical protein [Colocasia esculenta]
MDFRSPRVDGFQLSPSLTFF